MFDGGRKCFGFVVSRLSLRRVKRLASLSIILCSLLSAWPALAYQELFNFITPVGWPYVAANPSGVADGLNHSIRKVTPIGTNWVVTTIAGTNVLGNSDGTNRSARFNHPYGITADPSGNVFVADTYNNTIRKLTSVGTNWVVTTIAGLPTVSGSADGTNSTARFSSPAALALDSGGNLYVADTMNHTIRQVSTVGA